MASPWIFRAQRIKSLPLMAIPTVPTVGTQLRATTPVPNASVSYVIAQVRGYVWNPPVRCYVLAGMGHPVIRLSKQRWISLHHATAPCRHHVLGYPKIYRFYISIVNSFKFRIRVHCYVIFRQVSNEGIRRLRYIEFPIGIHKMWAKSVGSLLWFRNSRGKSWFTDLREKWSQSELPHRPSLSKLWCSSTCFNRVSL